VSAYSANAATLYVPQVNNHPSARSDAPQCCESPAAVLGISGSFTCFSVGSTLPAGISQHLGKTELHCEACGQNKGSAACAA